jgi:hypothetical protein
MSKMNLSFRVINSNFNNNKAQLTDCYDRLISLCNFANGYGMPEVNINFTAVSDDFHEADYILVSFQTDLVSDTYVRVLKDLLHVIRAYELTDFYHQTSPILKRKD